jgi:alpha-1,2-mannosyltransferase
MRCLQIHFGLTGRGGAERVALEIANTLIASGYTLTLLTFAQGEFFRREDNERLHPQSLVRVPLHLPGAVSDLILESIASRKRWIGRYDFIVNSSGILSSACVGDLVYVHFPVFLDEILNSSSTLRRGYGSALGVMGSLLHSHIKYLKPSTHLLFNSNYTLQRFVALASNFEIPVPSASQMHVVYPPVDAKLIRDFVSQRSIARHNRIVTLSRLDHSKNLELGIDLASSLGSGWEYVICGSESNPTYTHELLRRINEKGLSHRVFIRPNLSEEEKWELLASSKVYLHTRPGEHFGISIVEAMAAGLVPVSHSSGGPTEFIPSRYLFSNVQQALSCIDKAIDDSGTDQPKRLAKEALGFDREVFREKLMPFIDCRV